MWCGSPTSGAGQHFSYGVVGRGNDDAQSSDSEESVTEGSGDAHVSDREAKVSSGWGGRSSRGSSVASLFEYLRDMVTAADGNDEDDYYLNEYADVRHGLC